jgi:hypothetical protein
MGLHRVVSTTSTHGAADKETLLVVPVPVPVPVFDTSTSTGSIPPPVPSTRSAIGTRRRPGATTVKTTHTHRPSTHTGTHAVCIRPARLPAIAPRAIAAQGLYTHCALVCPLVDGYINCPAAIDLPRSTTDTPLQLHHCTSPYTHTHNHRQTQSQPWTTKTLSTS